MINDGISSKTDEVKNSVRDVDRSGSKSVIADTGSKIVAIVDRGNSLSISVSLG